MNNQEKIWRLMEKLNTVILGERKFNYVSCGGIFS